MSEPYGWQHLRLMQQDPDRFFRELQRDQGDIARFPLGTHTCWSFAHPQAIHQILATHWRQFQKTTRFRQVLSRALGNGLLLAEGADWLRQRQAVQPVLNQAAAPAAVTAAHPAWRRRIAGWSAVTRIDLDRIDLDRELRDGWMEQLLGQLTGQAHDSAIPLLQQSLRSLQGFLLRQLFQVIQPPRWWPFWGRRDERQALRTFHRVTGELWEQAVPGSLYHHLRQTLAAHSASPRAGLDEARTLLLNGYETTTCGLLWTLWHLAREPSWQDRVVAEIAKQTDSPGPPHSPILSACWHEALRLHPPAYLLSREVCERVEIAGQSLAAGDQVFLFLPLPHRDPRWFEAPDAFRPERFLPLGDHPASPRGVFPFGLGPRGCAGESWASQLTCQLLVPLLQRHRLTLPADASPPNSLWNLALAPQPPVWVIPTAR
ncbi:MAG: cytochrome P450 [Planctomycetaceae bacterium]